MLLDASGRTTDAHDWLGASARMRRLRAYALHESLNCGQPHVFTIAGALTSWVVALEDRGLVQGGLLGEAVLCAEDGPDPAVTAAELAAFGLTAAEARRPLAQAPVWSRARINHAAETLQRSFYQISGWKPELMQANRLRLQQQRQIAEAMEEQQRLGQASAYSFEKERMLLSMIRAGDRPGARRVLNDTLGARYLSAPKLPVLRARIIELMGYLTRAAVEDSPILEPLIRRTHVWTERLIRARDFESLCRVLTEALDDFMDGIYLQAFNRTNTHVGQALDYIAHHYQKRLPLHAAAAAAGVSTWRLDHLVRQHTGKTVLQLIRLARVQAAQRLLEHSEQTCAAIAYEVGYTDQSYFIEQFRKLTGLTPARYRRALLARGSLRAPTRSGEIGGELGQ